MRKLNSAQWLIVFITLLFTGTQSTWANDTKMDQTTSVYAVGSQSNLQTYDAGSSDSDDDDDVYKPDTVVAGQYSISADFTALGKPADIGC